MFSFASDTFWHAQKCRLSCNDPGNSRLFSPDLTKVSYALEPSGRTHFGRYSDSSIAILFVEGWGFFPVKGDRNEEEMWPILMD